MAQMNEKEGGTVVELTNPVDDRIGNPKSESNIRTTTNFMIPWSQNIYFVTTIPLTRRGVFYPRVRDFFIRS